MAVTENLLIRKYNVPGPRYTSYPTVPYWDDETFTVDKYLQSIIATYNCSASKGLSLYIHLPFCESLCTYCGCTTRITKNHGVEDPYINSVLKEWDLYLKLLDSKPVIKELHLGGGTPTFFSPENLKKLVEGILKKGQIAKDADFGFEAHPNSTSGQHLEMLRALGFKRVSFGIQDFDPEVQKIVNRIQKFETVKEVTVNAREAGYTSINYDLIYGLPLQKLDSIQDTINKVVELDPDRIAFYSYAHVPWMKRGQRLFTEGDLPDNEYKRHLYELGREMLQQNHYHEVGMDHFAKEDDPLFVALQKGELHRNFMGYTTSRTDLTIGLGVSAIGDSWTGFGQNVKVVKEYHQLIDQNRFPIFRGHILNKEDQVIRRHILDLMCNFETTFALDDAAMMDYVYPGLSAMEEDGLISLQNNCISVLPLGRPFIRNVCMALDARLRRSKPDAQIFSKVI